jgi:hypothetical protein
MKMGNAFPAVGPIVEDYAVAIFKAFPMRHRSRNRQKVPQQSGIPGVRIGQPRQRFPRDDEQVHWSLRVDVTDDHAGWVFVKFFGGNFARDDPFEKGLGHGLNLRSSGNIGKRGEHPRQLQKRKPGRSWRLFP